ncbi:iron-sulfur flavoprotein [Oxobacter pfennigii]|uniref:Iron-sulfur flavoprotein n=1 Tax=Oxobacter pfennigii TaxID=36849 RepID=A0A0P8W4P1_9CLOT|nr:flavodoxin family protein [Oxobacter pfennigii]KPU43549.1 iron-sulfur flavoprotein [Oxobacter pfennigii]
MKKITAFIGTASKQATWQAVSVFEKNLKELGDVEFEAVFLNECSLEYCLGCKMCFDKGEQFCLLKDDRDALLEKMENSDGVIFATPSYAFQVTARMKNFIDRMAFILHRPRFFGKTFMAIVTQGIPTGGNVQKYLENLGASLGFDVTRGCNLWTMAPMSENRMKKFNEKIKQASKRFYKGLSRKTKLIPSIYKLMMFRTSRSGIRSAKSKFYDYSYFYEKGWFESDYYYDVRLGPIKMMLGSIFDWLGVQVAKRM